MNEAPFEHCAISFAQPRTRWLRCTALVVHTVWAVMSLLLVFPGIGQADAQFDRHDQIWFGVPSALCAVLGLLLAIRDLRWPRAVVG